MKPIRRIHKLIAKHLYLCEHWLDLVDKSTLPSVDTGTSSQSDPLSQLKPRQSILQVKHQPRTFSKKIKIEFHADFLWMWIAIRASYWFADQAEVQWFFEKWIKTKNLLSYQCQGPLLKTQIKMLNLNIKEKITSKKNLDMWWIEQQTLETFFCHDDYSRKSSIFYQSVWQYSGP